ncbi:N-acetylneuraminate synthase family protein [Marinisporobacter balticus]|uniref:N,N'-diacetyllegionaminate synthase n=1 Tax=Marinisporobacter balticus TaxID=2018667 RepID=A0A4R2KRM6_9FIRM|nr:N-acetylneuraminate synthase family protein [Marinisporobacter balticus]TCO73646.1 N,N'-diacetyllegionaminate synthase [Marinisporobacter balticus]
MAYLKEMIKDIAQIGLDAVKFHLLFNPYSYLQNEHPLMETVKKWIFKEKQWDEIFKYASKNNLDTIALCDDVESLAYVNNKHKDIKAIELHATSLNDYFMLKEALKFNNQIILGVGGSTIDEIEYAVNFLKEHGKSNIFLMYGYQSYPTNYEEINLLKMLKLKSLFDLPIGYADHTAYDDQNNVDISSLAAAIGINVLEKHYTPDFGIPRIDYHAAVGKEHMMQIKKKMEMYLTIYGNGSLSMSEAELKYGNIGPMKKALVAKIDIYKGEKISFNNIWFKRTEKEVPIKQKEFIKFIGLEVLKDIKKDEVIDFSKVNYKYIISNFKDLAGGLEEKK